MLSIKFIFSLQFVALIATLSATPSSASASAKGWDLDIHSSGCGMDPAAPNSSFDCKFLMRDLDRDSHACLIDPKAVEKDQPSEVKVRGTIRYAGALPHTYQYTFVPQKNGVLAVTVKIHFKEANPSDRERLQGFLDEAQAFWQMYNPLPQFYTFSFLVTDQEEEADFSVHLRDAVRRGPYDQKWGRDWDDLIIQHEVGHMMGLDDEYPEAVVTLRPGFFKEHKSDYGSVDSVMFSQFSPTAKPQPYHYYLIYRRAFCEEAALE